MKKAIIFDLDGTLWDSTIPVAECWTLVGREIIDPEFKLDKEFLAAQMGKTMQEIKDNIQKSFNVGDKEINAFADVCFQKEVEYLLSHPGSPYKDVEQTFLELKENGYKVFICSNCQKGYIETFLNVIDKSLVDDYICFGDTLSPKYVSISKIIGRNCIDFAIYVGDTEKDKEAAEKAKIDFIYANYGFGKLENCRHSISSLDELLPLIKQYFEEK